MVSSLLLLLSYVSVLAHAVSLPSHYTTICRDVVVLGGGSSGTYAAVRLVACGRSVVVLDQKGRLGGPVETDIDANGAPNNVGVTLYNNTINNAYFSLLGVPMGPVALLPTGSVFLDLAPGKTVPRFDPVSQVDSFIPAMLAYAAYVNTTYPYLTLSYENLPYPLPSELLANLEPFTVFAARHNFTAMA
jgi:phytoene dehydrogenase-like protein